MVADMQKKYIVIEDYKNSNEDPIELTAGDSVRLGEKSDNDGPWANWIYCTSDRTGKSGWTPTQILKMDGLVGVATSDYVAAELTVAVGDILIGDIETNGWLWCIRETDNDAGWVPLNCLRLAQ